METITLKINWKKILKWLLFLGWLLFIYISSSQQGEVSHSISNGFVDFLKEIIPTNLFGGMDLNFLMRKFAHVSVFFVLGIITFCLLKEYSNSFYKRLFLAFLICFLCACMDEFHQVFVSGRDGKVLDILIDSFGSLLSLSFLFLIFKPSLVKDT